MLLIFFRNFVTKLFGVEGSAEMLRLRRAALLGNYSHTKKFANVSGVPKLAMPTGPLGDPSSAASMT